MARWGLLIAWICIVCARAIAAEPTSVPASAPLDPASPRAALKAFSLALDAGDRAAILKFLNAKSPTETKVAGITADLAEANAALRKAAVEKFGADLARPLGVDPTARAEAMKRIDSATEKVDGDRATISTKNEEGPPLVLVRNEGQWQLPVEMLSKDVEPGDIEKNLRDANRQISAMKELTAEVSAGKYKSAVDARQALDRRVMKETMPATAATQP